MAVYVDALRQRGLQVRQGSVSCASCHMVADTLPELHAMAKKIGLRSTWFQDHDKHPHYDFSAKFRRLAVEAGAQEVDRFPRSLLDGRLLK